MQVSTYYLRSEWAGYLSFIGMGSEGRLEGPDHAASSISFDPQYRPILNDIAQ